MKIVMPFGPTHRDDGGPFYLRKFLNQMPGVSCESKPVDEPIPWDQYDACLYIDWGQDGLGNWPAPTPPKDMPSVCWLSDTHISPRAKAWRFVAADGFRHVRFYHPEAIGEYSRPSEWLPAAADHTIYTPPLANYQQDRSRWAPDPDIIQPHAVGVVPRYDIGWIGHVGWPTREAFLDAMFKAIPNFLFYSGGVFFESCAYGFAQCRIVLNSSVQGDLNMRTFEALATRSFLLTDEQRGMETLGLKDGVHCAVYHSTEEAIEMTRWYLKHDGVRARIADAGWRWVLNGQTYLHRARTLLGVLENDLKAS